MIIKWDTFVKLALNGSERIIWKAHDFIAGMHGRDIERLPYLEAALKDLTALVQRTIKDPKDGTKKAKGSAVLMKPLRLALTAKKVSVKTILEIIWTNLIDTSLLIFPVGTNRCGNNIPLGSSSHLGKTRECNGTSCLFNFRLAVTREYTHLYYNHCDYQKMLYKEASFSPWGRWRR